MYVIDINFFYLCPGSQLLRNSDGKERNEGEDQTDHPDSRETERSRSVRDNAATPTPTSAGPAVHPVLHTMAFQDKDQLLAEKELEVLSTSVFIQSNHEVQSIFACKSNSPYISSVGGGEGEGG